MSTTPKDLEQLLPIVADSWEQLRACDVWRLLSALDFKSIQEIENAAEIVAIHRPDLASKARDEAGEIIEEIWANSPG